MYWHILLLATVGALPHEAGLMRTATLAECQYSVTDADSRFEFVTEHNNAGGMTVYVTSAGNCHIPVAELRRHLLQITLPNTTEIATALFFLEFGCLNESHIYFSSALTENITRMKIALYFGQNCKVDGNNLNNLSAVYNLTMLTVISATLTDNYIKSCSWANDVVYLWINNINESVSNISNFVHCNFKKLLMLSMTRMMLEDLSVIVTSSFPSLVSFNLANNNLITPPEFPWIYDTEQYNEIMGKTTECKLTLSDNKITQLGDFQFSPGIKRLYLQGNELRNVSEKTFELLNTLVLLDLSYNVIDEIPQGTFAKLENLAELNLRLNNISTIRMDAFTNLKNLVYLNLGHNRLETIPESTFNNLPKLECLYLDYNHIHRLPGEIFKQPLKYVYLNNNPLGEVPSSVLYIATLQFVGMSSSPISEDHIRTLVNSMDVTRIKDTFPWDAVTVGDYTLPVTLDFSNCSIRYIPMDTSAEYWAYRVKLARLLQHFLIKLDNNPLECACGFSAFLDYYKDMGRIYFGAVTQYMRKDWVCYSPVEFIGRLVMSVLDNETYCNVSVAHCPQECTCYERQTVNAIIVDCEDTKMRSLPLTLPRFDLELRFSGAHVENVTLRPYFPNITFLDLSNNSISYIDPLIFKNMQKLRRLFLHNNQLSALPPVMENAKLVIATIGLNPYKCDCNTKWMKHWLLSNETSYIYDFNQVKCNDGKQIIVFPDNEFICAEKVISHDYHIGQLLISSIAFLVALILTALTYAYRNTLKVILFVYTGLHPFDKPSASGDARFDAVVVHAGHDTEWVMDEVVYPLEQRGYAIVDSGRDFIVGFSFHENLRTLVKHSKRIILCVAQTSWSEDHEWFDVVWDFTRHKIKKTKSNFAILINNQVPKCDLTAKDLRLYIHSERYIRFGSPLFLHSLIYNMPDIENSLIEMTLIHDTVRDIFNRPQSPDPELRHQERRCSAFVSYHDEDIGYVGRQLAPLLEGDGYTLRIPDRDFMLGNPMAENILDAIEGSDHTIFIISNAGVNDKWYRNVFILAREETYCVRNNYLIILFRGTVDMQLLTHGMRLYIDSVITLSTEDRWFKQKLYNALNIVRADSRNDDAAVQDCSFDANAELIANS